MDYYLSINIFEGERYMIDRNKSMEAISILKEVSTELNGSYYEGILKLEDMLRENKYKVAVIGEFSSGKSTF